MLLLQLAAAGCLASSGIALSLAAAPASRVLQLGLAAHSAVGLGAGRAAAVATAALPLLAAAQVPRALHLAGLSASVSALASARRASAPLTLLLDIDGTLVQTDDIYFEAFKQLLTPLGFPVDREWYSVNVHGKTDLQVFSSVMPDGSYEAWAEMGRRKDALFCELYRAASAAAGPPMVAGLAEGLAAAAELGMRAIAVTNAPRGAAEACMDSLRQTIPAASIIHPTIVVGAECAHAKPHPEPYLRAARLLDVSAADCVVFEDSASGVRAGAAAGVRAVVGIRSSLGDDALRALGATITFDDWSGVTAEVLRSLADATEEGGAAAGGAAAPPASPSSASASAHRAALTLVKAALPVPSMILLLAGVVAGALPEPCARMGLLCQGDDLSIPTKATRATGATLLVLAAASHTWGEAHTGGGGAALAEPAARYALGCGLAASSAVGLRALLRDGHALRPPARRVLMLGVGGCGAAGLGAAGVRHQAAAGTGSAAGS